MDPKVAWIQPEVFGPATELWQRLWENSNKPGFGDFGPFFEKVFEFFLGDNFYLVFGLNSKISMSLEKTHKLANFTGLTPRAQKLKMIHIIYR